MEVECNVLLPPWSVIFRQNPAIGDGHGDSRLPQEGQVADSVPVH